MEQKHAEQIVLDCLQPIYGFVLKKTKTTEDAEDLTQEIVLSLAAREKYSKRELERQILLLTAIFF